MKDPLTTKARDSLNSRRFRYTNAKYQMAPQMSPARLPCVDSVFCGEDQKLISSERGKIPSGVAKMNVLVWGGRTFHCRSIASWLSSILVSLYQLDLGWRSMSVVRAVAAWVLLLFAMVDEIRSGSGRN